ncbi:hypothetical protein JCM1841_001872 [Sporobolomyces salmonicolor]
MSQSPPPLPPAPSPGGGGGGDRAPLLASAVSFLRDPSTSSSPLAQRIGFLESKGLTPAEIQHALAAAATAGGGGMAWGERRGGGAGVMARTREFERDWRDWFIMGVVGGGVGWLAVKLAKKFLLPHLQPPSESDLLASQRALEAKYDEAAALLSTLQASTDAVAQTLEEQREKVEAELQEVREVVREMREGEKRREEWSERVGREVDEMGKKLPGLLDKHASAQTSSLTELQSELKSLKSLLIARRPTPSSPSASLPPASSPSSSLYTPVSSSTSTPTQSQSPFGVRAPGLPAWQMKGSSAATLAAASPSSPGGGYSVPDATTSTQAQPEDPSASGVLVDVPAAGDEGEKKEAEGEKPEQGERTAGESK